MTEYQVAVVGGGPAGLAAALTLSRSMIRTVVFDSPLPPRNEASAHVAAHPGMDMASPQQMRETMAKEIANYGYADFKSAEIASISGGAKQGFTLATRGGSSFAARRVLICVGMVDVFPMIVGLKDRWGASIINCPFCQGFELRNRPWAIYVHRPEILAAAEVYYNWTKDLVMIVEPSITIAEERLEAITALGIELIRGTAESLHGPGDSLTEIVLRDGRRIEREVLLLWPKQVQSDLVKSLVLRLNDDGYVDVDNSYRTGRVGIYAAGDLTYGGHQNTNTAVHMGNMAAAWIVFDLCHETAARQSADETVAPLVTSDPPPTEPAGDLSPAAYEEPLRQPKTA
ncbi:MAG: NAD(P)/FAD-dependent oxidoreductase [Pseudomonadota bacterium]